MNRHILVIANETAASSSLVERIEQTAKEGDPLVTVIAPVSQPSEGYVVYEDTRRASAGRRLDRTLETLRRAQHSRERDGRRHRARRRASRTRSRSSSRRSTEVIVSTHPKERSGWMRRNVVDRMRKAAASIPVEHVVVDPGGRRRPEERPRDRERDALVRAAPRADQDARRARACELPDRRAAERTTYADQPEAERRLRRLVAELRAEGIDAHGQIAHPDPYTAAMQAVHDERVDEIIVSTFPGQKSGWLRRDLVSRLHNDTGVPVEHVVSEPAPAEVAALSAHAEAADHHHGPPIANQSSRVDPRVLGMFLFIASEVMLFGSFFTAYFFVRVVDGLALAAAAVPAAGLRRRREHGDPRHVALHDPLGAPVDQARQPRRPAGRARAHDRDGPRLPAHADPRVLADRLRTAATAPSGRSSSA